MTQNLPTQAKFIEQYHGRLWLGNLSTGGVQGVRCSDLDSTSFAVSVNQVFKAKDTVRGIKTHEGELIVGTKSSIEAISGYHPHDFAKRLITDSISCASHWSILEVPVESMGTTGLIWAGYDGIYMKIGGNVNKISWKIQPFWDTLSKVRIEESSAVDNRETGEYMLAVSDGSTAENNYVIVYNYRKGDWSIWRYANKIDVLGWYRQSGNRYLLGGDTNGNIYRLDSGYNDNGGTIDGYVLSKWFDAGDPAIEKDFRQLIFWYHHQKDQKREPKPSQDPRQGESQRPQTPEEKADQRFRQEAGMPKERAMQLLDALQQNEKAEQQKALALKRAQRKKGKDW